MSKTVKKLLSVVLAVLVLAAGFSTMLGSFVMAEPEWTYNYDELVPEFDGTAERYLANYSSGFTSSSNTRPAPESFEFFDYSGIATNISTGAFTGLRISDWFFSKSNAGAAVVYGGDVSEVHPYITYQVEPGTEFKIKYFTYEKAQWGGFNLAEKADEFYFLEFLVSSDGVNFVPVVAENSVVLKTGNGYDTVTSTVKNVGANTKYIKVQFPFDPSVVTQQYNKDTGKWADSYVPQDSFFIQKVKLTKPTNPNSQRVVSFTTGAPTINGTTTTLDKVFELWPATTGYESYLGLRGYDWSKLSANWDTYAETDRDYFLQVQPGSRFYLSFNDHPDHDVSARALVANGKIAKVEDFAWKVYSAENLEDLTDATKRTEHDIIPVSVPTKSNAVNIKYNFIVPENHTYIRIVDPISGGLDKIDYSKVEKSVGVRGNDRAMLDTIVYSPLDLSGSVTDNYFTNGTANNHAVAISGFAYIGGKVGLGQPSTPVYNLDTNLRPDDELAYAVYAAQPGTVFNAHLDLKWRGNNWGKSGYDTKAASVGAEDFYFEILTSSKNANGVDEWNLQTTLGKEGDAYVETKTKDTPGYQISFVVPEDACFVKIVSHFRGAFSDANGTYKFDDNGGIKSVSFTPLASSTEKTTYDYQSISVPYSDTYDDYYIEGDASQAIFYLAEDGKTKIYYKATDEGAVKKYPDKLYAPLKNTDSTFNTLLGSVAAGNSIQLDCATTTLNGISITYTNRSARGYLIYNVEPGTVFEAKTFMNATDKAKMDSYDVDLFEFIFSGSATQAGTYNVITNTETTLKTGSVTQNIKFIIPEGVNYIKVEFPQTTGAKGGLYANHSGWLNNVSFVPAGKSAVKLPEGVVNYDYTVVEDSQTTSVNLTNNNKANWGIYEFASHERSTIAHYEGRNLNVEKPTVGNTGLSSVYNNYSTGYSADKGGTVLRNLWGEVDPTYVIYAVKPGTEFNANFYLHPTLKATIATEIAKWKAAGDIAQDAPDTFDFVIEAATSLDGGWKNALTTDGLTNNCSLSYNVPADCNFVKVTFPQHGGVKQGVKEYNGVSYTYGMAANDLGRLLGVTFTSADATVVENDYTDKSEEVLRNETKAAFEIYNYAEVEVTENGIAASADAENAYVIYKVSNAADLVIKSAADLDISVSYDGKNYVDAQITAYQDTYTVMTIAEKVFVKVEIPNGKTITGITAATLTPTATFINAAGKKEVIELNFYGATPAPTLNTARAGYTFKNWDNTVGALYLDATFEAVYEKAETNYAITVENGTIVSVAGNAVGNTEATARFDDRVVIEAPATYSDGNMDLVFDKWVDAKGNTVSNSHKFSFLASGALALTAEYAEVKGEVNPFIYNADSAIVTDNGDKWNMSVTWSVNVPAGATIKETGIVLAATDTEMTKDAANTATMKHSSVGTGKTLMFTVTGIKDGTTRYARPYAVLADDTVIYGTTVTATDAQ